MRHRFVAHVAVLNLIGARVFLLRHRYAIRRNASCVARAVTIGKDEHCSTAPRTGVQRA